MTTQSSLLAERAELLSLLRRDGILYASENQPVLSRDGTTARWMLDSLCVSMTHRGAQLAGRCLVELLDRFDGCQIATYGVTGIPLLDACLVQGQGKYRGLILRKKRKPHGSRKRIEGIIDYDMPTILVDDSVSSGTSMLEGTQVLEEAGLRVEGGVCLVRFGWYGGHARMLERGYRMESVFDIWEDFVYHMPDEPPRLDNPTKAPVSFEQSDQQAPEGLAPDVLARRVIEQYMVDRRALKPPQHLDRDYDSCGGAWVSVRRRDSIHKRYAREGFWHFPAEPVGTTAEDLTRAALLTAAKLPAGKEGLDLLKKCGIAVTFFSQLEECEVGQLDNDVYGIVVRSRERRAWMGGALPQMPGIVGEWHQFHHAGRKNGKLVSFEPYRLYRHRVDKVVEQGVEWQKSGTDQERGHGWYRDPQGAGQLANRIRDNVVGQLTGQPWREIKAEVPEDLDSIFVSLYKDGRLFGCMGCSVRDLDEDLRKVIAEALRDARFATKLTARDAEQVVVVVSLLFQPLTLGQYSPEEVMTPIRLGQQALCVFQKSRLGLLLPTLAVTHNLSAKAFALEVIDKAGITRPPYNWRRFECATWLTGEQRCLALDGLFPRRELLPEQPASKDKAGLKSQLKRFSDLFCQYTLGQRQGGSLYPLWYSPCQDQMIKVCDTIRLAHLAWTLAKAARILGRQDLFERSNEILQKLFTEIAHDDRGDVWFEHPKVPANIAEVAFVLLAFCQFEREAEPQDSTGALARTLWNAIDRHGRIKTHRQKENDRRVYQDYFPGQALLALATGCAEELVEPEGDKLSRAFVFYRHRFRYRRDWGQVSWMAQAWAKWYQVTGEEKFAAHVFEIVDWALQAQLEKNGGFANAHQPNSPGYTTALYLEAVVAALGVAQRQKDEERATRYLKSLCSGMSFLDGLVIQTDDTAILPNPQRALGGLRESAYKSHVRIDFVQHAWAATLEAMQRV